MSRLMDKQSFGKGCYFSILVLPETNIQGSGLLPGLRGKADQVAFCIAVETGQKGILFNQQQAGIRRSLFQVSCS